MTHITSRVSCDVNKTACGKSAAPKESTHQYEGSLDTVKSIEKRCNGVSAQNLKPLISFLVQLHCSSMQRNSAKCDPEWKRNICLSEDLNRAFLCKCIYCEIDTDTE